MQAPESGSSALLTHARNLHALVGTDRIVEYLGREAREMTGAALAVVSCAAIGQQWQRGVHMVHDGDCRPADAAAVSAAFAIHRRLSAQPQPLTLQASEETAAIFTGLCSNHRASALLAVPLINRRKRLVGQLVLLAEGGAELGWAQLALLLDLASLASLALENAERLAFARRDQDRLLLLAEATEEALWDWDLELDALWWGGGIQNILRHGGIVIGGSWGWKLERVHAEDVERVRVSLAEARASTSSTWRAEFRFRRGDDSWAVVEDRGYFMRDANGRAYRMLGAMRDVTEQKWLQQQQAFLVEASSELAASLEVEKNLATVASLAARTVADWCSIVLFATETDASAAVAVADRGASRTPPTAAVLQKLVADSRERLLELDRSFVVATFGPEHRSALTSREPALGAVIDEVGPRSALHAPLMTGGRVVGFVTLVRSQPSARAYHEADLALAEELARRCGVAVDKARLYEQAQNAIRARDAFMAILGHELRNPLSPITTALHLMKLRDPRGAREQEVITRQIKHMTRLVDDLLDVSRIERGKMELSRKPVQLAEVIAKAVEIASPLLEQRRHRLELDVPANGLPVLADETRLAQVVANLLTNAARYTNDGGHIVVRAAREGKEITLSVKDNGIGLSKELLPRVFDLFVQGPNAADRRQGGLGLGLSLVQSLVALHGGSVEAKSEGTDKGSEFIVRLPAMVVELVPNLRDASPTPGSEATEQRRVLIVDDNTDAADLLGELLQMRGHLVALADDGPSALITAPRFDPDIAILDIGLPVMDGHELARRLLAILPRRPFLVALTGYGQTQDRARALESGFDEHLVKPVAPEQLIQIIEGRAAAARAGQQR